MAERRKDSKGRVLRDGETQRSDGKYMYRYTDASGERRTIYSWRLVETDKPPTGKRSVEPLREMEKRVRRDVEDGIISHTADRTTLNDFYDAYIATKCELKSSTRTNYKYLYERHIRGGIGTKKISSIKYSDIKKFYIHLIQDTGLNLNSVENVQTVLHPIFRTAVRDGYIRVNPTDGVTAEIKRSVGWERPKRHALTVPQQERFIEFVSSHSAYRRWMTLFTVMLGTGARVGEIVGLRWEDCDFENNIIDINHNLTYRAQEDSGLCEFHVTVPKTNAGTRVVPMLKEVKEALLTEYARQKENGFNTFMIDGYTNFIFCGRPGEALNNHIINRTIEKIIRDANIEEQELAREERREPVLLPHFSCHHLRHTFCTRLCENESNIKIIQEIMGHRDIGTTMDVYNEATMEKKKESFAKLEGKIRLPQV